MSVVIAIPTNALYAPMVEYADRVAQAMGAKVLRGTEQECHAYLGRHIADVALVSPLGYATESLKTDLRIVPVSALTLDALTYSGSIYLRPSEKGGSFGRCASPYAEDFLMQMGAAVLSEKFDVEVTLEQAHGSIGDLLRRYDGVLDYGFDKQQEVVLDISDEWSDYFGELLPLALWVCRPEEVPDDIAEHLAEFRQRICPTKHDITEEQQHGTTAHRTGVISTEWNDETEEALQHVIELLYYWQYIPKVAATKLWQRDIVERV